MNMPIENKNIQAMQSLFMQQKSEFRLQGESSFSQRQDKLKQLKQSLLSHQNALVNALNTDYGQRPTNDSLISEILPCINNINYTLKRLKKWMKPESRHAGLLLAPAKVQIHYQPLGVIGIIVPWNFPVMLSIGPLITAIAAGNRAMLKLSEFTPATNQVLKALIGEVFDEKEVTVIEGEADIASAFSSLAFDHLLFTGSTQVGRHVMTAAAKNLTPVTLELGGKSPVIITPDMPIDTAVERLIYGKCLNAGQICVAPDYILCPEDKQNEFIHAYQAQFTKMYGKSINTSQDYGTIINQRQFDRLLTVLEDAKSKGAQVISASSDEIDHQNRKLATQLITNTTDEMLLMQEEIFGPLLPIVPYKELSQAVDYINDRPRPLALYIMGFDENQNHDLLKRTHSGGACINETLFHVAADDAPFGGIGPSGMGHYHGIEGFKTFSHTKTLLKRGKFNTGKLVHPPYGNYIQKALLKFFLR